jgi:integrase
VVAICESVANGEAGLRCGEIMTLEWNDVDLGKRQVCIQRSAWKGHVTATKGGRLRYVPLTMRLAAALCEDRHLRGTRVLRQRDGAPRTQKIVQNRVSTISPTGAARQERCSSTASHVLFASGHARRAGA